MVFAKFKCQLSLCPGSVIIIIIIIINNVNNFLCLITLKVRLNEQQKTCNLFETLVQNELNIDVAPFTTLGKNLATLFGARQVRTWVVKRATLLVNWFSSNVAKQVCNTDRESFFALLCGFNLTLRIWSPVILTVRLKILTPLNYFHLYRLLENNVKKQKIKMILSNNPCS